MATPQEFLENLAKRLRRPSPNGRTVGDTRATRVVDAARLAGTPIPTEDMLSAQMWDAAAIPVLDAQRNAFDTGSVVGGATRESIDASLRGAPQSAPGARQPQVSRTPGSDELEGLTPIDIVARARAAADDGSPSSIIEQRIINVARPTMNARGEWDPSVFAGKDLAGGLPNIKSVNDAFAELASKYGVELSGDPAVDRPRIATAIVNDQIAQANVIRSQGTVLDVEGRRSGEALTGGSFPNRRGPYTPAQVRHTPVELREQVREPIPILDKNGKPVLADDGTPMVQLVDPNSSVDGSPSETRPLLVRQSRPFTRSQVFAARDPGDGGEPVVDRNLALTTMAVRRNSSDGNRSPAEKMFVLPTEGPNGERMYQIVGVDGVNELISERAMQDMMESQGWEYFAGPNVVTPRAGSLMPSDAAGRQLVEYAKSGASNGIVLAVRDLDRLKAHGTGELFQQAIAAAGGGATSDEVATALEALALNRRLAAAIEVRNAVAGPDLSGPPDENKIVEILKTRPEFYGAGDVELREMASLDAGELENMASSPFSPAVQAAIERFQPAYARGLEVYKQARATASAYDPQIAYQSNIEAAAAEAARANPGNPLASTTDTVQPENMRAFLNNDRVEVVDPNTGAITYKDPVHEKLRQLEMGYAQTGRVAEDGTPETDRLPRTVIGADPAANPQLLQDARDRAVRLKAVADKVAKARQAGMRPTDVLAANSAGVADSVAAATPSVGTFTEVTDPSMSIGDLPMAPKAANATAPDQSAQPTGLRFLDSIFGVRQQPSAPQVLQFGTTQDSWADQVRRARSAVSDASAMPDLGDGPIDVSGALPGDAAQESRRLSIAIGVRNRLERQGGGSPDEVAAALRQRPEFSGAPDDVVSEYSSLPVDDLRARADAAMTTTEAFGEGRVAGPRVMTQITRGALPGNINAQRPIASQQDVAAGSYRSLSEQQKVDFDKAMADEDAELMGLPPELREQAFMDRSNSAATQQHLQTLRDLEPEIRGLTLASRKAALMSRAARQHLADLQWRQKLASDPDLRAQVEGTPDAEPLPISARPEFAALGVDSLAGIERLVDEGDIADVLDSLKSQQDALAGPLSLAQARRRNASQMLADANARIDSTNSSVGSETLAAERSAGSEDVGSAGISDALREASEIEERIRQADADFAREYRPALEDFGLARTSEQMREAYATALRAAYGSDSSMPLAARDFDSRMPDGRPSAEQVYSIEDLQRAVDKATDPDQKALLQARLEERAGAFSGDTGSAAVKMKHPSGQNQARLLKELASTASRSRRLELVAELWRSRRTGMDSGWRAPMLPQTRKAEEHGIAVLQAISRQSGMPVEDIVYEALARNPELRDYVTPSELRHAASKVQADLEYTNRYAPNQYDEPVGPPMPPAGQPADSTGIRGILSRIKGMMGIGAPDVQAPKSVESFDPNDPVLMALNKVESQIGGASGNTALDGLNTQVANTMAVLERAGTKGTPSHQAAMDKAEELRRAIKRRMDDPMSGYKPMQQRQNPPGLPSEEEAPIDVTSRSAARPDARGVGQVVKPPEMQDVSARTDDGSLGTMQQQYVAAKARLEQAEAEVARRDKGSKKGSTPEDRAARQAALAEREAARSEYSKLKRSYGAVKTTVLLSPEDAEKLRGWMSGKLTDDDASVDRATGWPKLSVSTNKALGPDGKPIKGASDTAEIVIERGYRTYDDQVYDPATGKMVSGLVGDQPRDATLKKSVSGTVLKPVKTAGGVSRPDIPEGMVAVEFDADGNPSFFNHSPEVVLGGQTFLPKGRKATAAAQPAQPQTVRVKQYTPGEAPARSGSDETDEVYNSAGRGEFDPSQVGEGSSYDDGSLVRETSSGRRQKLQSQHEASVRKAEDKPSGRTKGTTEKPVSETPSGTTKKRVTSAAIASIMALGAAGVAGLGSDVASGGDFGLPPQPEEDTNQSSETVGDQVRRARQRRYTLMTPMNPVPW